MSIDIKERARANAARIIEEINERIALRERMHYRWHEAIWFLSRAQVCLHNAESMACRRAERHAVCGGDLKIVARIRERQHAVACYAVENTVFAMAFLGLLTAVGKRGAA